MLILFVQIWGKWDADMYALLDYKIWWATLVDLMHYTYKLIFVFSTVSQCGEIFECDQRPNHFRTSWRARRGCSCGVLSMPPSGFLRNWAEYWHWWGNECKWIPSPRTMNSKKHIQMCHYPNIALVGGASANYHRWWIKSRSSDFNKRTLATLVILCFF